LELIKLIIIDDEAEVRELLEIMLGKHPQVRVVGSAGTVDDGIQLTLETNPELILLDIQMPGKDGFAFLNELERLQIHPAIIFITAFENYAVRAIKNSAIDYLLKPIKKEELNKAIERFIKSRDRKKLDLSLLADLMKKEMPGRIKLNTRSGYFFVDPAEIIYIEADGNYSKITLGSGKSELSTLSLGNLEKLVEGGSFLRVSRSYLLNMKYITKVDRRLSMCELEYNGSSFQVKVPPSKIKLLENYY